MQNFTPLAETELLKKIQKLEEDHAHIIDQMSHFSLPRRSIAGSGDRKPSSHKFSDGQFLNILRSVGQSVHAMDKTGRIIYWNKSAEDLYGYLAEEALGEVSVRLLVDSRDFGVVYIIVHRVNLGETWTGQLPVRKKSGERFTVIVTNSPFFDDAGSLTGVVCMCMDAQPFYDVRVPMADDKQTQQNLSFSRCEATDTENIGVDFQQPPRKVVPSKLSNFASKLSNKVKLKFQIREHNMDPKGETEDINHLFHCLDSGPSANKKDGATNRTRISIGTIPPETDFGVFKVDSELLGKISVDSASDGEGKSSIHKRIASKAEEWIIKQGILWPWRGNKQDRSVGRGSGFVSPWFLNDQVNDSVAQNGYGIPILEVQFWVRTCQSTESLTSSLDVNTISHAVSLRTTNSGGLIKVDMDIDCMDYEIMWEDMIIGAQVGQGSCRTVYHGQWDGSDVAIKVFPKLEYSADLLLSFKEEVSLMKRLRHPNVLLFMGAVTSPECLCIVTEFLPRYYRKAHQSLTGDGALDMAMDIAWGMNYLHHISPPIIHRDLKSSNLLVDKNWTVKVGDFGLSRLKHETFLKNKGGRGTPQWMASEFMRNEPTDEKADIYSYGVILWELSTEKIPWGNLINPRQVIGVVGFMNQRLEIPKDVDPQCASIIESCWHSVPACRPSFLELLEQLKVLHRQYNLQFKATSSASCESTEKEYVLSES